MKIKLIKTTGTDSSVTADNKVFNKPNDQLLAQAIRVYLSNQRQGTSKTKTRSEVSRTTRKWYRQKGTGNARHGARDANIFVGGGDSHGPTGLENWQKTLTKELRKQSLIAALSAQVKNIVINDELAQLTGKTKEAHQLLTKISEKMGKEEFKFETNRLMIVFAEKNDKAYQAFSNIPNVIMQQVRLINALEIVQADKIIFTTKSFETLQNKLTA